MHLVKMHLPLIYANANHFWTYENFAYHFDKNPIFFVLRFWLLRDFYDWDLSDLSPELLPIAVVTVATVRENRIATLVVTKYYRHHVESKHVSQTRPSTRLLRLYMSQRAVVHVLFDYDAIGRGSNPTVADTVVKNFVVASWKIGTTRVPFVRPFKTLNTTQNSLYIYICSSTSVCLNYLKLFPIGH